jgi:hypothetical protein
MNAGAWIMAGLCGIGIALALTTDAPIARKEAPVARRVSFEQHTKGDREERRGDREQREWLQREWLFLVRWCAMQWNPEPRCGKGE